MSEHEKEIIRLNLQLVYIRVEHQMEKWNDLLPKENALKIVEKEIQKQLDSI